MEPKSSLGDFEATLLMAIMRLGSNAYGMTIRQTAEEKQNRHTSIGAVYTTLDRMEAKGFVSSWQGEATAERGGRAKRYFKLEATGQQALDNYLDMVQWQTREAQQLGLVPKGGLA